MKKLKFNSMLNHKQSEYKTREIIVEKVITLYGKSFSYLKNHTMNDNPYITENRDLLYTDSNDAAHCLLMVDYDSGDDIWWRPRAAATLENHSLFQTKEH